MDYKNDGLFIDMEKTVNIMYLNILLRVVGKHLTFMLFMYNLYPPISSTPPKLEKAYNKRIIQNKVTDKR